MELVAEFRLKGTPKLINAIGRSCWQVKAKETKLWKQRVFNECYFLKINELNLTKAKISFFRHSSRECDFDSLVNSFKACLDGLVLAKVIIDDNPSVIDQPSYKWVYSPLKVGKYITIKVERE